MSSDDNLFPCLICNTPIDYDYQRECPHCGWSIEHYLGDDSPEGLERVARDFLRPARELFVQKQGLNVTDFSWTGYSKDLEKAMNEKNNLKIEDFNADYSPSFFKEWHEDDSTFDARLAEKPILLGSATWQTKLFKPATGEFPIEITWHSRITDKNQNKKYYIIIDKSIAKITFDATPNPDIYLALRFDELKQIYAEKAFLIANQQIFEVQPLDSIQSLDIQADDENAQNGEQNDAEMQTQFKPKIIQPLPKTIAQNNQSIYNLYCDFMGKLYGRKYSADDLDSIFTHDDRILYLFGLSLENIVKERGLMQIVVQSQVAIDYICKSTELLRIVSESKIAMKEVIISELAMNLITNSENAMAYFITASKNLTQFGSSDIATQIILNSENAMNFIKNNPNSAGFLSQKTSDISIIKELTLKLIDFNPESFDHFDDVVNSSEAMNAIANSEVAMKAINASTIAIGKYVAKLANLNPSDFKDIEVVANSEIAMKTVANSEIAMKAVANSEIAMKAVANSEIAMKAVANSEIAMKAVANSDVAMKAINASQLALDVLYQNAKKINYRESNWKDVLTGKHLLVRVKCTEKNDYSGSNYIKIDKNYYITSENFNTGTSISYSNGQLIDNYARLINESLSANSYCTFEFAYYKLS